jgi:hypothetical protein
MIFVPYACFGLLVRERATVMSAVAGDLDPISTVRAALAAMFLVIRHDAPARRVCALFRFNFIHW